MCNGINDCEDNSDEEYNICPKSCNSQQFACQSAKNVCIPLSKKCDDRVDCSDGSDEKDCARPCNATEFACLNGRCISLKWKCDRDNDCGDNSDEANCSFPLNCSKHEFMCANTLCIPSRWRCDGDIDCHDNSDEIGCGKLISATSLLHSLYKPFNMNAYKCNSHEYRCDNGHCIMSSWRCDGDTDCLDGSDEKNCSDISCHSYEFKCKNHKCILGILECNGLDDCGDNSDEINCDKKHKKCDPKKEFDCGDTCIPESKVCNGNNDCGQWQDELHNCGVNECLKANGGCSQKCIDLKKGFYCDCQHGYSLSPVDNVTCLDTNECLLPGTCSQICMNTEGGFKCECHANYSLYPLADNSTFCKASGESAKVIFANRRDIRMIDSVPLTMYSKYKLLVSELHSSVAIDFDIVTQRVFWSDVSSETIYSTPLVPEEIVGSNKIETIVEGNISMPDGISVDWIYRLIYWTDTGKNTIEVARLADHTNSNQSFTEKGSKDNQSNSSRTFGGGSVIARKILFDSDLDEPRAILIDPRHRYLYWTDWGAKPKIEKCGANGVGRRTIVSRNIVWPNGLAIDFANNRLFWVDAKLDQIVSSDLEGQNRYIVLDSKQNIRHPFAITVFEDWMYWTDWENETLFSANKFTGADLKPLARDLYSPMDVRVYHPLRQPVYNLDGTPVINVCGSYHYNGGCQHLCLPGPSHNKSVSNGLSALYICACSTGWTVDPKDAAKCILNENGLIANYKASENGKIQESSTSKNSQDIRPPSSSFAQGFTKIFNNNDLHNDKSDIFSRNDDYNHSHYRAVNSAESQKFGSLQQIKEGTTAKKSRRKSGFAIFAGVFITFLVTSLIIFLLWKNYSNRTIKSLNFDNPVYRKTTEDQISLPRAFESSESKKSNSSLNGGYSTVGEESRKHNFYALPAQPLEEEEAFFDDFDSTKSPHEYLNNFNGGRKANEYV
ncbi:unnamed protein product [Gordionus sp. m RMFG-2023]